MAERPPTGPNAREAEDIREARSAAWSRYWASGALHSCAGSFSGNYDDALEAFWRSVFAGLGPSQRVLDIGCGNGPLELLLLQSLGPEALPQVDAIDLARPQPPFLAGLPQDSRKRLHFHAGVAAEQLPFEGAAFDLALSQYGLEYSELARSLPELRRVLKPGAGLGLVMHHQDALPVQRGRDECAHLDWLLAEAGLLDRAEALLPWLAELGRPGGRERLQSSSQASADREAYNRCVRGLAERAAQLPTPDPLHEAQAAVAAVLSRAANEGLEVAAAALRELREGLAIARLRQAELVACALDGDAIRELSVHLVGRAPTPAELGEVRIQGQLFGWTLALRMPDQAASGQ